MFELPELPELKLSVLMVEEESPVVSLLPPLLLHAVIQLAAKATKKSFFILLFLDYNMMNCKRYVSTILPSTPEPANWIYMVACRLKYAF